MKKILQQLFLGLIFLSLSLSANAQQPLKQCGHDLLLQQMEAQYPGYQQAVRTTFDQAQALGRQLNAHQRTTPIQVNVVVHIVWKNAAENLADSVINNQMAILNADFNDLNADRTNVRPVFDTVRGNANINFNLYEIRRVQTTQTFSAGVSGLPDSKLKVSAQGGSDAADVAHFINIWVCNLGTGGVLGYAFPPNNLPNWPANQGASPANYDGLVIDYRAFGANNPNPLTIQGTTLVVEGRTPIHEMGHYLGLRHIWGDNPNPFAALLGLPNDCLQSDGVSDTPFASKQSNFDCALTQDGCTGAETHYGANVPDMVENHMDYSSETCQVMFTKGQCALMQGVLAGPRVTLTEPLAVNHISDRISFQVFPNPNNGVFTLDLKNKTNAACQIHIYNVLGEAVAPSRSVNGGNFTDLLDLSSQPKGCYFVEVVSESGRMTQKVIVLK